LRTSWEALAKGNPPSLVVDDLETGRRDPFVQDVDELNEGINVLLDAGVDGVAGRLGS
jgi:hypothetical protein